MSCLSIKNLFAPVYIPGQSEDESSGTQTDTEGGPEIKQAEPTSGQKTAERSQKYGLARKVGIAAFAVIGPIALLATVGLVYMATHGGVIHTFTQGFNLAKDWVVNHVKNMIHSKPMQDMIHFMEKSGQTIKADVTKWGQIAIQDVKNAGQAAVGFVSKHRLEFGLGFGLSGTFVAGAISGAVGSALKPLQRMRALRESISGLRMCKPKSFQVSAAEEQEVKAANEWKHVPTGQEQPLPENEEHQESENE